MKLYSQPVSGAPHQYVADETDLSGYVRGVCPDEATARANLLTYLEERVAAVLDRDGRRPAVLLSGGIDSILLAAVVARFQPEARAVTVHFEVPGADTAEVDNAVATAAALGLAHTVVRLSPSDTARIVPEVVAALDSPDPWEVLAGVVLRVADTAARDGGAPGALFSGAGADAVFLGGEPEVAPGEWHDRVAQRVADHFLRDRAIPDFYERLLTEPDRHIQVWQTTAAVELAFALQPEQVRGEDLATDKRLLREAARQAGVPVELTTRKKDPVQVSSGGVAGLVLAARAELAGDPRHTTYTDPTEEPVEHIVSRLWLQGKLKAGGKGS